MSDAFHISSADGRELVLAGRVYADAAPALRAALAKAAARADVVVVDATRLEHVDGIALQAFVDALKTLRPRGGRLVFFGLSPIVARTLALTGLARLVTIAATRDDAHAAG